MNITKVKAIYFTGTGTTAKATTVFTQAIAELFDVPYELICINVPGTRNNIYPFSETELAVVATPTYAGRVPNLLLPFFQNQIKGNNSLAVPLVLYGNRSPDDALMELRNTLNQGGFACVGGATIVGQHAFAPALGHSRPYGRDYKLLQLLAKNVYEKIDKLESIPDVPLEVPGNDPVGPYYTPRDRYGYPINILKVRPKTQKSKCNNCNLCIKLCPTGAISPDPAQIPGPCMKCSSCIVNCPQKAKYFDDEGFNFHKKELEAQFSRPNKSEIFY